MNKLINAIMYLFLLTAGFGCRPGHPSKEKEEVNDWFISQRIFPYGRMDYQAYRDALHWRNASLNRSPMPGSSNHWQFAGCINIGGRITDVEMHASDLQTIYIGAASGGVFKSPDAGNSWFPVFDNQTSLSIGDIAIAPSDPAILYVGTGEANGGGGSLTYDGNGVYKSTDSGLTWTSVGLELTRNTGRMAIDPDNPDRVFAATMGDLFGNNPDRGLYRTTDGGSTWQQVLSTSDSTGAIDVVINPQHPDTVFACLWERVRRPDRRNYGGPSSGIYRSYNGGNTWIKLTNGLPSGVDLGRIGIDISKSNPNILYATVTDYMGAHIGLYKTVNNGDTWTDITNGFSPNAASYWYGRIKVDPVNPDIVYEIDFDLWQTTDGGQNWFNLSGFSNVHVDQHELYIHPLNHDFLVLGNDGGIYTSYDGGSFWTHDETLPVTQFYTCEMDETNPSNLYGGAQDNGVNCTVTGQHDDWFSILGGDGFVVLVDPANPNLVYAEYQYAGLNCGTTGVDPIDRVNWNAPFIFNPQNSNTLYLGTDKVYKSTDNGSFWDPISPDLTNGSGTASYPIVYGTITTLAVAPSDTSVIWAGTDDGNIQLSTDEGASWNLVSGGLPYRWVTRIAVDPVSPLTAYATLSGYRYHDNMSHVYKTTNGGGNWTDIGAGLPDVPVNDIILDSTLNNLYIATDAGVFYTPADSLDWQLLGDSMPVVPVLDLRLHEGTRTLLAATYGRSMYTYDLSYLTSSVSPVPEGEISAMKAYPSPFTEYLAVSFYVEKEAVLSLSLLDLQGRKVSEVFIGKRSRGNHSIRINNGSNVLGLSDGVYLLNIKGNLNSLTQKVIFNKTKP